MSSHARAVATFPSARLPSRSGGLPIEVTLIAQLGHGSGDQLVAGATARQRAHAGFIDAMDEPSAKLAGADFEKGDPTSLYSFTVEAKGHPFHRHAGHRVFTAISGSGGVQLRFSDATPAQVADDPMSFLRGLRYIDIPPDCLFTVRFGGDTWHQFASLRPRAGHPALFALSCHTNELGGDLPADIQQQIRANEATIPSLTELLPLTVQRLLDDGALRHVDVPTMALSLDAPAGSLQSLLCRAARGVAGRLRGAWAHVRRAGGFAAQRGGRHAVMLLPEPPADSLLHEQLQGRHHHQDTSVLGLDQAGIDGLGATALLSSLLDAFIANPPPGVSHLMAFRNVLVKPLGLRTSSLGCPVSSLLGTADGPRFMNRYPVIDQRVDADDTFAQVILGADDKHLRFRSCVAVRIRGAGRVELSLGTRVQCTNLFGHAYMAVVDHFHRSYASPTMLRAATEHAFAAHESPVDAIMAHD
ncbi:hypothetical protein DyAD56_13480 [Dyella sp. AD56]|uniref:DUF2867 domain-containing protein n=1 Tax=Dyella sp. AD56 TaxID=1528744 RepID=UPI000C86542E|nr:DUF2867 domain-containing protein [Dyella sp. AD56]PMQ04684.1 hypothetical protein DyAD56_13480 [Dyella sp. AD56]